MCVRYLLQNAYVFEADILLYNPKLIKKYQYSSNYLGIPVERTDDWCFTTKNGIIQTQQVGGEILKPHTGSSNHTAESVVVTSYKTVDLVAECHNKGQQQKLKTHHNQAIQEASTHQCQLGYHAQQCRGRDGKYQNRQDHYHKQEACTATGMQSCLGADILHRKGQACLIATDGFMLSTVIFKHTLNIL